MRLSTVALSLLALGVASVSAIPQSESSPSIPVARDFARKMEVRDPRKHHSRGNKVVTGSMMTYYAGNQLRNPACGGATPTNEDHVVAVKKGGPWKCGQTIHIHHHNTHKTARVVDYCESCAEDHVDATKGLFQEFADLEVGVIHGLTLASE